MDAQIAELSSALLTLAGGVENVTAVERCFVRLRLVLADPALADVEAINDLPGVALALHYMGQLQIAPLAQLDELHATVARIVAAR